MQQGENNQVILSAKRLQLRYLNSNDATFIMELLNSEGWLRYIGDRNIRTIEDAQGYIEHIHRTGYTPFGFGLYLVELKESHVPIGICGLIRRDHWEETDLGFALLPQFSGKGYACEAARVVLEEGYKKYHISRIIAIVLEENLSSLRLLEKLGFNFEKKIIYEKTGEELLQYSIAFQG